MGTEEGPEVEDEGNERLWAEVDLRLSEQAARADALATRSGVMVAAVAIAASLLASRVADSGERTSLLVVSLLILGLSALAGVLVLCMARMATGPSQTDLATWALRPDRSNVRSELFAAKIKTVEANTSALTRLEIVFYAQALSTVVATGLALFFVGKS